MKKLLIAGAALAALIGTPALAADLAQPVYKAPPAPPTPVLSWTGFYIGLDIGGRWSDPDWSTTCLEPQVTGVVCGSASASVWPGRFAFNNPSNFDSASVRGGVYGGYNYQIGSSWVVGIEGDWAAADNNKTKAGIPGAEDPTVAGQPGADTSTVKQTWDAGVRGRIGYLVTPAALLYVTGGGAWTHVTASAFCGTVFQVGWCTAADVGVTSSASTTMGGWTIGGGLEYMVAPNWLVRGEYRYTDFGHFNYTLFSGLPTPAVALDSLSASLRLRTSTALFGIAYKFGGGPIAARY